MDNYDISSVLSLYAKLAVLFDVNPFKVKAYESAAFNIKRLETPLDSLTSDELLQVPMLGKGLAPKIEEIIKTGSFEELNDFMSATPKGVLEMLKIKGLGPKKVHVIWREMGIDNPGDLLLACKENRMIEIKGFGLKTQQDIISKMDFYFANSGKYHYSGIEQEANDVEKILNGFVSVIYCSATSSLRRKCEILEELDYLVATDDLARFKVDLEEFGFTKIEEIEGNISSIYSEMGLRVNFIISKSSDFVKRLFETTATKEHLRIIGYDGQVSSENEESIYASLKIPFIIPEMREGLNELDIVSKRNEKIIELSDIKGIIHNHSTYSDGLHTLEQMAVHCKSLGYEYFGIADHSQTAVYARGLKPEVLFQQWEEIDALNKKLAPFVVLKGIESDILNNGELDYSIDILKQFDYVVASVHSNLNMEMDKAHIRLKNAIENPYTTILGHPTGRLLLMRKGYPINHEYIIDACAANGVVIELNANPWRLDMDWRHIYYAQNKGVMISINPDAHEKDGLLDVYYGVLAARKGGLYVSNTLNALGYNDFMNLIARKKGVKST